MCGHGGELLPDVDAFDRAISETEQRMDEHERHLLVLAQRLRVVQRR